uniref:Uncharacterized protein n=1 Tax=Anguilla anguilla TaxID=7936 RepID=A0A0E9XSR1_ANGAN
MTITLLTLGKKAGTHQLLIIVRDCQNRNEPPPRTKWWREGG